MSVTPRRRRADLAETLRRRLVSSVSAGLARRGDRLASAREVAVEFDADPRLVLAAYRILAREGLVSIRRRSGIYVAAAPEVAGGPAVVAQGWLVDTLLAGLEQGIAAHKLGDWLRRCMATRRVRIAVVAGSDDHLETFCGELREDYGLDAVPFAPEALERPGGAPPEMLNADIVAAPEAYVVALRRLLPVGTRIVTLEVRRDLDRVSGRDTPRGPIVFVVSDRRTLPSLELGMAGPGAALQSMVVGQDDVSTIPVDASVYVSRAARLRLNGQIVPGRMMPTSRAFTARTARELLAMLVDVNLSAMQS